MKNKILICLLFSILFIAIAGLSPSENDSRIIVKLGHNSANEEQRTASLYLVFKGDKSDSMIAVDLERETRFYAEVWDDLYLQVTTESSDDGIEAYHFAFSKDEAGNEPAALKDSKDKGTLRVLAAADFRTVENSSARVLKPGPGTPDDPGAFRLIHYGGFDAEIRVLEFNIAGAIPKKKPYFKSLSCIVGITENNQKTLVK